MRIFKHTLLLLLLVGGLAWAGPLEKMQRIGKVRIAMTLSELRDALGPPAKEGRSETDATTGWTTTDWNYTGHGLRVRLANDGAANGTSKVWGFTAKAPCKWSTPQGVHVGTTRAEVVSAYQDLIDSNASSDEQIVVGRSHDGIVFQIKQGRVVEINVGPGAPL
jgi:hypothetical protein